MNFKINLVVATLALSLVDQGESGITEIGKLPKTSQIKISRRQPDDYEDGHCTSTVVVEGPKLFDTIDFDCAQRKDELFNQDLVIVDGAVYSDAPDSVQVWLNSENKCQRRTYSNGKVTPNNLSPQDCDKLKKALEKKKSLQAIADEERALPAYNKQSGPGDNRQSGLDNRKSGLRDNKQSGSGDEKSARGMVPDDHQDGIITRFFKWLWHLIQSILAKLGIQVGLHK